MKINLCIFINIYIPSTRKLIVIADYNVKILFPLLGLVLMKNKFFQNLSVRTYDVINLYDII